MKSNDQKNNVTAHYSCWMGLLTACFSDRFLWAYTSSLLKAIDDIKNSFLAHLRTRWQSLASGFLNQANSKLSSEITLSRMPSYYQGCLDLLDCLGKRPFPLWALTLHLHQRGLCFPLEWNLSVDVIFLMRSCYNIYAIQICFICDSENEHLCGSLLLKNLNNVFSW